MRISVALAYYQGGKYIDDQVESILSQLGPEDELVISIDSAEDGSMPLLEAWQDRDQRIRLIQGPGQGVVKNFEHAMKACSGDLIFLSDQDDIWEKNKVKLVKRAMEKTGCLALLHNAVLVNERGEPEGEPDLFTLRASKRGLVKNILRNSYVGCCMAFRKELLRVILPIPDQMYMHDYWIGTAAELCGRVAFLKKPLIRYRRHGGNVTEMKHGSLGFMVKKRVGMLYCLAILIRRKRRLWKKKEVY